LNDFTYEELEATFRRRKKKAMPKLWSYTKKLQDPYSPKFYTTIELFVPQPTLFSPLPCIIVSIRSVKFKAFFRVADLETLDAVFNIPEQDRQNASVALLKAQKDVSNMETLVKSLFAGKTPAQAVAELAKNGELEFEDIKVWLKQEGLWRD
jgi:hypothetical protein